MNISELIKELKANYPTFKWAAIGFNGGVEISENGYKPVMAPWGDCVLISVKGSYETSFVVEERPENGKVYLVDVDNEKLIVLTQEDVE